MPAAIAAVPAIGWITTAAAAGATATGQIVSSRAQSRAQREATAASTRANDEATRYQREQDALDRADAARVDNERRMQWQAEQDRLAPYREQQEAAARRYSELTGVPMPAPSRPSQMPPDWGRTGSTPPVVGDRAGQPGTRVGQPVRYDPRLDPNSGAPPYPIRPPNMAQSYTGVLPTPTTSAGATAPSLAHGVLPPESLLAPQYRRPQLQLRPQRSY